MAIVVDKEAKRRNIAMACRELLLENGIKKLTIAQIAQEANVGKGTIYEYFENKDDIVFEIIRTFLSEYQAGLSKMAQKNISTREKLFRFFSVFFDAEEGRRHLDLYKEFLSISMTRTTDEMQRFNEENRERFISILDEIIAIGISKGELSARFRGAASSMVVFNSGLVVHSRFGSFDIEQELNNFLDLIFDPALKGEKS